MGERATLTFTDLPDDIIGCIAIHCRLNDILSLLQTCKQVKVAVDDEGVWQSVAAKYQITEKPGDITWKQCVQSANLVFLVGGYAETGQHALVFHLDVERKGWKSIPLPLPFCFASVGAYKRCIIMAGGEMEGHGGPQDRTEMYMYDTLTHKCEKLSWELPRPLWSTGCVLGEYFYLVGGYDVAEGKYMDILLRLDLVTGTWEDLAPMPTARFISSVAVHQGKIYVAGGYIGHYLDILECYDPATDTWATLAPMPQSCARGGFITCGNYIYMTGGYDSMRDVLDTNQRYDPATNMWKMMAPLPTIRWAHGVAVQAHHIIAIGGHAKNYTHVSSVDIYDTINDQWVPGPDLPTHSANGSGVSFGGPGGL